MSNLILLVPVVAALGLVEQPFSMVVTDGVHRRIRQLGQLACAPGHLAPSHPTKLPLGDIDSLLAEEIAQRRIDLVGVRPQQAVWRALDLDVVSLGERSVEAASGGVYGEDVVLGSVQDQRRLAA